MNSAALPFLFLLSASVPFSRRSCGLCLGRRWSTVKPASVISQEQGKTSEPDANRAVLLCSGPSFEPEFPELEVNDSLGELPRSSSEKPSTKSDGGEDNTPHFAPDSPLILVLTKKHGYDGWSSPLESGSTRSAGEALTTSNGKGGREGEG